jgi:hypothetical protein
MCKWRGMNFSDVEKVKEILYYIILYYIILYYVNTEDGVNKKDSVLTP